MIECGHQWPDDRFEILSRLSSAAWFSRQRLVEDLGWSLARLSAAVAGIKEMGIRITEVEGELRISSRSWDLAQIAIAGYEKRMDEADYDDQAEICE